MVASIAGAFFVEGFERDPVRALARLNQLRHGIVDASVQGIVEISGVQEIGNVGMRRVVDQDRAQ
jgi:hypothetical protein